MIHERLDRGRVGGIEDDRCTEAVQRDRIRHGRGVSLDVRGVAAGRADEGVLADGRRVQELLRPGAAHQAVVSRDDDVLESELLEDPLVRVALRLVRGILSLVGVVERVRVLHGELAAAQEAGAGTGLVAVLVLDLVDRERQVLVRGVEVLHQEREHLLVRRCEQIVGALAILQAEDAVAVGGPPARRLVRLTRQQRREVNLVRARARHLVADDRLDLRLDLQAEGQPREDARGGTPDVAGAHEQPVARDLGVGGVFAEGAEEEVRQTGDHEGQV